MEFFNNKANNDLKFRINAEGIDVSEIQSRLVFITNEGLNYIIFGDIEDNVCTFNVPELKIYEQSSSGKVRFELVADDLYYNVWEDAFDVKVKKSIKLNEMFTEAVKEVIPTISVEPVQETKKEVVTKKKPEPVKKKVELIKEVKKTVVKKKVQPVKEKKRIPIPKPNKEGEFVTLNQYLNN